MREVDEALHFMRARGASARLVRHHELVVEAANELLAGLRELGLADAVDARLVRLGAALHDIGKLVHPGELDAPGDRHERAGEALLREAGHAELARFAISHTAWQQPGLAPEDLLVALADKLWKGKRVAELEQRVITALAASTKRDAWSLFVALDDRFETIAAGGAARLARSR